MAGIYIHIPFCKQACNYCNFHFSTTLSAKDAMVEALVVEMREILPKYPNLEIETIYLGGGTPSLLNASAINLLIESISSFYDLENLKEVTLEANPDDLSIAYLSSLKSTLVNRLSIGIQSFFEEDLRWMNRAHNAMQAEAAIKLAQDAGFHNLTIDLIYGTPTLTNEHWLSNLQNLVSFQVPHYSAYALTVEPNTALGIQVKKKIIAAPSDNQAAAQHHLLQDFASKNNYLQYEVSNFAKEKNYAVHNTNYWLGKTYLGFGPGAHSFHENKRWWNVANNAKYLHQIGSNHSASDGFELLTITQQLNEYLLTRLRTMWGIDLLEIANQYGQQMATNIKQSAQKYLANGWLTQENQLLKTTEEGMHYADGIAAALFQSEPGVINGTD